MNSGVHELLHLADKKLSFTMQNLISSHFQDKNTVLFYEKISIGSMVFTTENKEARYCNSFIKHGEHFACIEYIATDKANIMLICKKIVHLHNPFYSSKDKRLTTNFFLACKSNETFLVFENFSQIKVVFSYKLNESRRFLKCRNKS
ncbi:hypothetical protein BpHYR1_008835 [Brachionus plicatilis]|uniref:Uncharacterized protein n=1 Tax=Brachionus plicatilis TaxID=10195 RepID=A0A3M7SYK9_BRAPC|nr:hypothetical protein BpHYR1_008835 [Brachionus plicatilis]